MPVPRRSPLPAILLAAVVVATTGGACGKSAPAPADPTPAPADPTPAPADPTPAPADPTPAPAWTPRPDLAVIALAEGGFATVDVASGARGRLEGPVARWCRTDPRAGVVWFLADATDGSEDGLLHYIDLAAPGSPVAVASLPQGVDDFAVAYPDETLVLGPPHRFRVAAVLALDKAPRIESRLGCDGDMSWFCYEDEADDAAGDTPATLIEELRDLRFAIDEVRLVDDAHVGALVARADKKRAFVAPGPMSEGPRVDVAEARCDAAPELCGTARAVPNTPWLEVVVSNDRGDFYYEERQLYDPETKRFIDANDPRRVSATPLEEHDAGALEINARGAWLTADAVVTREGGALLKGERTCGWAGQATRLGD